LELVKVLSATAEDKLRDHPVTCPTKERVKNRQCQRGTTSSPAELSFDRNQSTKEEKPARSHVRWLKKPGERAPKCIKKRGKDVSGQPGASHWDMLNGGGGFFYWKGETRKRQAGSQICLYFRRGSIKW